VTKKMLSIMIVLSVIASAILGLGVILASGGTPKVKMTFTAEEIAQSAANAARPMYEIYAEIARDKVPGFAGFMIKNEIPSVLVAGSSMAGAILSSASSERLAFLDAVNVSKESKAQLLSVLATEFGDDILDFNGVDRNTKYGKSLAFQVLKVDFSYADLYDWAQPFMKLTRMNFATPGFERLSGVGFSPGDNRVVIKFASEKSDKVIAAVEKIAKQNNVPMNALSIGFNFNPRFRNSGGGGGGGSGAQVGLNTEIRPLRSGLELGIGDNAGANRCSIGFFAQTNFGWANEPVSIITAAHCLRRVPNDAPLTQPFDSATILARASTRPGDRGVTVASGFPISNIICPTRYSACRDTDAAAFIPDFQNLNVIEGGLPRLVEGSSQTVVSENDNYRYDTNNTMNNNPMMTGTPITLIGSVSGKRTTQNGLMDFGPVVVFNDPDYPSGVWALTVVCTTGLTNAEGDSGGFIGIPDPNNANGYILSGILSVGADNGDACWDSSNEIVQRLSLRVR
jgi:hypothetical protein